jgi:hypothetical protein
MLGDAQRCIGHYHAPKVLIKVDIEFVFKSHVLSFISGALSGTVALRQIVNYRYPPTGLVFCNNGAATLCTGAHSEMAAGMGLFYLE